MVLYILFGVGRVLLYQWGEREREERGERDTYAPNNPLLNKLFEMLQVLNQSCSPKPDPPSLFPSRLASAGAHVQSVPGLHPGHILWILPQSLHQCGPSWNEWEVTDELIHAHDPSQTQPHWHAGGKERLLSQGRSSSYNTFQKDTHLWNKRVSMSTWARRRLSTKDLALHKDFPSNGKLRFLPFEILPKFIKV